MSFHYSFAKLKSSTRWYWNKLKSKLFSLKASGVYDNWHKVLETYFLGSSNVIILRDSYGNKAPLDVNKSNVNKAIMLARALTICKEFKIEGKRIELPHGRAFNVDRILHDDLIMNELYLQCLTMSVCAKLNVMGGNILIEIRDVKFITRPNNQWDLLEGALLPYYHEPYEYNKWFLKYVQKDSIFVDVGAYIGGYSVRAGRRGAFVIAIEPDVENFNLFKEKYGAE